MLGMKEKTKNQVNFGLGILAGALIGYYLASDQGKELRMHARQRLEELSEELGEKFQEQIESILSGVDAVFAKGQQYAQDVESSFKSNLDKTTESAEDMFSGARSSFMRGMERARQRLKQQGENGPSPSSN
jgi:gas vesicle protein